MRWFSKSYLIVLCAVLISSAGCSKQVSNVAEQSQSSTTESSSNVNPTAQTLTGIWYGEASFDKDKFQAKIDGLTPQQQQLVVAKANSFLSTVMAIEFRNNGTVENEVEIQSVDGQIFRDRSFGSWTVVEKKPNGLVVETKEELPDGSIVSSNVVYQFVGDKDHIAIVPPVADELSGCDSYIIFERRSLVPTNIASRPLATQTH